MYKYSILFIYFITIICASTEEETSSQMSKEERIGLREEARKMFYHAYDAYMDNAFPADELMPLSCKGRWRGVTPSRGDLDDVLGNFSLTLVDSLDTLVILGDFQQFNRAIKYVINNVRFDTDLVVSVFETNIRMVGGLLSAHALALELREMVPILSWYSHELLGMAEDLGKRLLPAFNTSTGIPYGRVNLLRGMRGIINNRETCTACAGTIILEFAALSRMTGNPIFEQKAARAMDRLWKTRHRTSELMGTTIDVHSGDWVRKDSGVGAGIDSYYEYLLKAYVLLGDTKYLTRFHRHYNAIKKYISRGPLMLAVYMHRPLIQSRNFMDALLAFWPGIQVMMGDLRPAVETHEMLYQVMQRHTFIPEAFTSDFQVHWGQHPLRPEFLESTYFLHRATGDDHYLRVGRDILRALQRYARVPCGYAAVNDVRTRAHEDRMDSFVLAETFKYLFLLFGYDHEMPVNLKRYLMTTEAHYLPLNLRDVLLNVTARIVVLDDEDEDKTRKTCPNTASLEPEKMREPMRQMVGSTAARPAARLRPLNDPRQVHALSDMGISVLTLPDGRVQLLYTTSTARSPNDAAEGLTFMTEMSKWNSLGDAENGVRVLGVTFNGRVVSAGPAHFGKEIGGDVYEGTIAFAQPPDACSEITNKAAIKIRFAVAYRGQCTFMQKVRNLQLAGARLAIIIDITPNSSSETSAVFAMSNDGKEDVDVVIPSVFLYGEEGKALTDAYEKDENMLVTVAEKTRFQKLDCPDGRCKEELVSGRERESFDHLKTVLSQLVAQFELSLNADEAPKRNQAKRMYPEVVFSMDKFVNEERRSDLSQNSGCPVYTVATAEGVPFVETVADEEADTKEKGIDRDRELKKHDAVLNAENNERSESETDSDDVISDVESDDKSTCSDFDFGNLHPIQSEIDTKAHASIGDDVAPTDGSVSVHEDVKDLDKDNYNTENICSSGNVGTASLVEPEEINPSSARRFTGFDINGIVSPDTYERIGRCYNRFPPYPPRYGYMDLASGKAILKMLASEVKVPQRLRGKGNIGKSKKPATEMENTDSDSATDE